MPQAVLGGAEGLQGLLRHNPSGLSKGASARFAWDEAITLLHKFLRQRNIHFIMALTISGEASVQAAEMAICPT
jgi:hypothetical protein